MTLCFSTASSADTGSKRSTSSTVADVEPDAEHHVEPEDVEQRQHPRAARRSSSSALPVASVWRMFTSRFRWVSTAACGAPAVPEVKMSTAGRRVPVDHRRPDLGGQLLDRRPCRARSPPMTCSTVGIDARSSPENTARPTGRRPRPSPRRCGAPRPSRRRVGRAERHRHQARGEGGEVRHHEVAVVAGEDRDPVPRFEPQADEARSEARDLVAEAAVVGRLAAADQRDGLRRVVVDERRQVHRVGRLLGGVTPATRRHRSAP